MSTPEGLVKSHIDKLLKSYSSNKQLWWYKPQSGAYGRAGIPDYIGCFGGWMFAIEAKAAKGVLTVLQKRTLDALNTAGAKTFIVRGTGGKSLKALKDWLDGIASLAC